MPCDPSLHIAGKNWFSESYVRKDPGPEASKVTLSSTGELAGDNSGQLPFHLDMIG
jgi:hypothetical protein